MEGLGVSGVMWRQFSLASWNPQRYQSQNLELVMVMCLHSDWCKSVGVGNVFGWWHLFGVPVWITTEASAG